MNLKRAYPTLLAWREAHGWSQRAAAQKLGISQTYYSRLERGVQTPRRQMLKRIAKSGVPLEVLLGIAS